MKGTNLIMLAVAGVVAFLWWKNRNGAAPVDQPAPPPGNGNEMPPPPFDVARVDDWDGSFVPLPQRPQEYHDAGVELAEQLFGYSGAPTADRFMRRH